MSSAILSQFCLICSNYYCQEEALHQKITFLSIQGLLLDNALLSVSLEENSINRLPFNILSHLSEMQSSSNNKKHLKSTKKPYFSHGISNCTSKIVQFFSQLAPGQASLKNELQPLLLAYITSIELLGTIKLNSLLYHDVMKILKHITMIKFGNKQNIISTNELPFTKNRIQRTFRQLRQRIQEKEKTLKIIKYNNSLQSTNTSNILKDLTNQPLSRIKISQYTNDTKFYQIDDCLILKQILQQSRFFDKLAQIICTLPTHSLCSEDSQVVLNLSLSLMSQIERLEIDFIQKLQIKEYERVNYWEFHQIQQNQKENTDIFRLLLSPEKKSFLMVNASKKEPNPTYEQIAEHSQFAYIEGLPFPTNRRSIDFSLLELTDELLMSYLPALEKLKDLEEVCIRKNRLSLIGYRMIKNLFPDLHSIDLRQNVITPQMIEIVLDFKRLNILYLSECKVQPASLVKICLNLSAINILYCDRLNFDDCCVLESPDAEENSQSLDLRGIFYIMCLNLKKLMYFSVKGCFSKEITQFKDVITDGCNKTISKDLSEPQKKQIKILSKISQTLKKRHGILQF